MFVRSFAASFVLFALACASNPPAESPDGATPPDAAASSGDSMSPEAPASEAPVVASGELSAGTISDGVTITQLDVRQAGEQTVVTVSFDGAGPAPATKASWGEGGRRVVLDFFGVREVKTTPPIPLVTGEGGTAIGRPSQIGVGLVDDLGRYFLGDDSAIRIELGLNASSRFSLREATGKRAIELTIDRAR